MPMISYWTALDYGCCSYKNLGIQLPPTTILITLLYLFFLNLLYFPVSSCLNLEIIQAETAPSYDI